MRLQPSQSIHRCIPLFTITCLPSVLLLFEHDEFSQPPLVTSPPIGHLTHTSIERLSLELKLFHIFRADCTRNFNKLLKLTFRLTYSLRR